MRQEAMARRSTVRWSQSLERRCSRLHPLHLSLSPPTSCGRKYKRPIFFFSAQRASTKPRISHNSFRLSSRGGISQGVHPSVLLLHSSVHGVTVICTGLLFISPLWLWDHRLGFVFSRAGKIERIALFRMIEGSNDLSCKASFQRFNFPMKTEKEIEWIYFLKRCKHKYGYRGFNNCTSLCVQLFFCVSK